LGNNYSKKIKSAKPTKATAKSKSTLPWKDAVEPEAPYHPSAKLGVLKVSPRSPNQKVYLDAIDQYDMVFGIGPAGSGKTYLAVAKAVQWLAKKGNRLVLVRPAVEAGEKLGFLPGSMQEKVDPYLRPIYDALYSMMDIQRVERYIEDGIIEVAALAFMRGRTFSNAFVLVDEAQNTTAEQMKMVLTRLGENSKMVITGDDTQIDLPKHVPSGLVEAERILERITKVHFSYFENKDIVRHPLVAEICDAYDEDEGNV
jgi:phosphate starvation-inducible PhoH-like protein